MKLWTIKNNECVRTLDAHEDKIWGLHCSRLDDRALTGASDSCVIVWKVLSPGPGLVVLREVGGGDLGPV